MPTVWDTLQKLSWQTLNDGQTVIFACLIKDGTKFENHYAKQLEIIILHALMLQVFADRFWVSKGTVCPGCSPIP